MNGGRIGDWFQKIALALVTTFAAWGFNAVSDVRDKVSLMEARQANQSKRIERIEKRGNMIVSLKEAMTRVERRLDRLDRYYNERDRSRD